MAGLQAERGFRILIIDACRNNLAVEQAVGRQVPGARSILVKRGLSAVNLEGKWVGAGLLVAFATLPGDVASDGAGRNSPFTLALVKHLPTPNLELRHLFVRVRAEVVTATLGRQFRKSATPSTASTCSERPDRSSVRAPAPLQSRAAVTTAERVGFGES